MREQQYAVILAGGSGERFWPLSTRDQPKQFISIFGGKPLLRLAVERLQGLIPSHRILIITSERLLEATRTCAPEIPEDNIVGEPCGRDTAAACTLACALVRQRNPKGVFCILTADHLMQDVQGFRRTLADALDFAMTRNVLMTIGIQPTYPATGYGYIETGDPIDSDAETAFFLAKRFVEKPAELVAQQYLSDGRYYWNGGMFIWNVDAFSEALTKHYPELLSLYQAVQASSPKEVPGVLKSLYPEMNKISIDYALMEKADNIVMARGDFGWDDVGSWPAMSSHFQHDAAGNIEIGACEMIDASDNIVVSEPRLTALIGVTGLVVVHSENATLICPRERAQEVKAIVARIGRRPDADKYL